MSRPYRDLTGQRFGKLVALEPTDKRRNTSIVWLCQCDCGNTKEIASDHLTRKKYPTKSCGCGNIEALTKRSLPEGRACRNSCLGNYKRVAGYRNLEWDLSGKDFDRLTQGDCYYCGKEPAQVYKTKGTNGPYIYNGIDRIENSEGYALNNCVSCCHQCNWAKRDMPFGDFVVWINCVSEHLKSTLAPKCAKDTIGCVTE